MTVIQSAQALLADCHEVDDSSGQGSAKYQPVSTGTSESVMGDHILLGQIALGRIALGRIALGRIALGRFTLGRFTLGRFALGRFVLGRFVLGQRTVEWSRQP